MADKKRTRIATGMTVPTGTAVAMILAMSVSMSAMPRRVAMAAGSTTMSTTATATIITLPAITPSSTSSHDESSWLLVLEGVIAGRDHSNGYDCNHDYEDDDNYDQESDNDYDHDYEYDFDYDYDHDHESNLWPEGALEKTHQAPPGGKQFFANLTCRICN